MKCAEEKWIHETELLDHITDVVARMTECQDALRRKTAHVLTRITEFVGVNGGIFCNLLY